MSHAAITTSCVLAFTALLLASCSSGAERRPISSGCPNPRQIALTFDDGPNPPDTDRILGILESTGAKATFFVTGAQTERHPEYIGRLTDAGMAIAAHSYDHERDLEKLPSAAFIGDLRRTDDALTAAGATTHMFRAPYGHWSDTMLRALADEGYTAVGWDIDSRDWDAATTTDHIVRNVIDSAHPGGIVLLHDGGLGGGDPDRSRTIEALPRIIEALKAGGYALVTVPEITGIPQAGPAAREPRCD